MNPNRAKKADVIDTLAAENRRFSKIRTGSIGLGDRSSHDTNAAISAAAIREAGERGRARPNPTQAPR